MHFYRRQAVKRFHNSSICHFKRLLNGFALYKLCCHGARGYCRSATERFKLYIFYNSTFYFEIHFHYISAFWISYFPYTVSIFNFSDITRICKMIHYFFAIIQFYLAPFAFNYFFPKRRHRS